MVCGFFDRSAQRYVVINPFAAVFHSRRAMPCVTGRNVCR